MKFWALLAASTCLVGGCASMRDIYTTQRDLRDVEVRTEAAIADSLQILTYCAMTTTDTALANKCLDGVLAVIGLPDERERVYASSMTYEECAEVVRSAKDNTKSLRKVSIDSQKSLQKMVTHITKAEKDSAISSLFRGILWTAGLGIFVWVVIGAIRKPY